jgi:hypothetical protein
MKKVIIIALGLLSLGSCQNQEPETYQEIDMDLDLKIDLDYIKSISNEGFTNFDVNSYYPILDSLSIIEDAMTIKAIEECQVDTNSTWHISASYNELRAYQWDIIQDKFCFSIVQWHDDCCLTMYCCALAKDGRIKGISTLGTNGGDGGWSINTTGIKTHSGAYHVTEEETEIDYVETDEGDMEIESLTHTEYLLRFQDSLFERCKIIKEYTTKYTFEVTYGC